MYLRSDPPLRFRTIEVECSAADAAHVKATLCGLRDLDLLRSYSAGVHDGVKLRVILDSAALAVRGEVACEELVARNTIAIVLSRHRPITLPPPRAAEER